MQGKKFRFDTEARRLFEGSAEVPLSPKALDLLALLVDNPNRILSKSEVIRNVWGGAAVTDDALVQRVLEIRKALGDNPANPRFVRTHARRGYEWISAENLTAPSDGPAPTPKPFRSQFRWLVALALAIGIAAAAALLYFSPRRTVDLPRRELSVQRLTALPGMEDYPAVDRSTGRVVFASDHSGSLNLWILDPRTGERRPLTEGHGNDTEPDWSPDGRWIAFSSERGRDRLYAVGSQGGDLLPIAPRGHHPRWSPDSRKVVFHTEGADSRVFVWDLQTRVSRQVEIAGPELTYQSFPVWTTDGQSILFLASVRDSSKVSGAVSLGYQVWRVPASGGSAALLTSGFGVVRDGGFDIKPDGSELVFIGLDRSLWKIGIDPRTGRPASAPRRITLSTEGHQHPRFTPEGEILFSTVSSPESLWLIPFNSTDTVDMEKIRRLTRSGMLARSPSLSPDFSRVAYITWAGDRFEIWCLNVETGRTWRASPQAGPSRTRPFWSGDGKALIYLEDSTRKQVAGLLDSAGERVIREVPVGSISQPENLQLAVSDAGVMVGTGAEPGVLASKSGRFRVERDARGWLFGGFRFPSVPSWSPDEKGIFFTQAHGGWFDMWRLPVDPATGLAARPAVQMTSFHSSRFLFSDMNRGFAVHPEGLIVSLRETLSDLWLIR